jgi:hypothetical protein
LGGGSGGGASVVDVAASPARVGLASRPRCAPAADRPAPPAAGRRALGLAFGRAAVRRAPASESHALAVFTGVDRDHVIDRHDDLARAAAEARLNSIVSLPSLRRWSPRSRR